MNLMDDFAMAVFDVNSLKLVNDSMGHDAGDAYLIRACSLICDTFKYSPVFRIGGDEFVAILTGSDYIDRYELLDEMSLKMSPYTDKLPIPDDYISIAFGVSEYQRGSGTTLQDVLKGADTAMYEHKAKMKGSE